MERRATFGERIDAIKSKINRTIRNSLLDDAPPASKLNKKKLAPTLAQLRELSQKYTFAGLLPYEAYDEDHQLYYNVDTVGFMLIASPATGLNETNIVTLNSIFNDSHPENACIQISIIDDANIEPVLENWRDYRKTPESNPNSAIFRTMAEKRYEYLKGAKWNSLYPEKPFLVRNYHLVISYTVPLQKGYEDRPLDENQLETLQRARGAIISNLKSANIVSQTLRPTIFLNIMNELLNPSRNKQPKLNYDNLNPLNVQMVDSDTTLLLGGAAASIIHKEDAFSVIPYHVREFPREWAGMQNRDLIGSFTDNILRLPCRFVATLTVLIPDQVTAKGMAKRKVMDATRMAESPIARYATQWKDRKRDWQFVSERVENGDKLLQAFYQVLLITPQGKEGDSEQKLKDLYASIGWIVAKSRYVVLPSILGALPMGLSQDDHFALRRLKKYRTFTAWNCTNIAPWIGEWKGTGTPMMLLMGRRGQITYFNPYDNKEGNYNCACCATSGAGKSFFINEWVSSVLATGGRAFVIDAGRSYENICQLYNGTYIDFGQGTPILNPFSKLASEEEILETAKKSGEIPLSEAIRDYYGDFLPMLKALLTQMASPHKPLEPQQAACLEKAIYQTVMKYGNKSTITLVTESLREMRNSGNAEAKYSEDIALMLASYTKDGMYGKYFEGESNINLDNSFVVLELDALNAKGDLQAVVLLILMMQINQVMYLSANKSQKKIVVIDEAWRLLKSKAGAFIEEGYRVARKHGGSYTTITQKISDYYSSETATAAYMNSDYVFYLRQKQDELTNAVNEGYIDDSGGKVTLLRSLETAKGEYSELAISSPSGMSIVRFVVDKFTEKVYSTDHFEVQFIRDAKARGLTLEQAVEALLDYYAKQR